VTRRKKGTSQSTDNDDNVAVDTPSQNAVTRVVDPAESVFPVMSVASAVYEPQPVITVDSRDNDDDDDNVAVDPASQNAVTRVVDPAESVFPVMSVASAVYEPQPVITFDSRDNDDDYNDDVDVDVASQNAVTEVVPTMTVVTLTNPMPHILPDDIPDDDPISAIPIHISASDQPAMFTELLFELRKSVLPNETMIAVSKGIMHQILESGIMLTYSSLNRSGYAICSFVDMRSGYSSCE